MMVALALAVSANPAAAQQKPARTDAAKLEPYKIILVGDSTMAPMSGWASMFCAHHVKSSVACLNVGRGGRSTRSYRQEGSWDIALSEAKVPGYKATYVLIQFGHNDQSSVSERWTDLATEFGPNLTRMVQEVRAAGAIPVLLTPLTRREFKDGTLNNTLVPWSNAVRTVATALKVPLVDLNARSAALVQQLGAEKAAQLAQAEPTADELAAARAGTTLKPRPAEEARLPDVPTTATRPARPVHPQVRLHARRRCRCGRLCPPGRQRTGRGRAGPEEPDRPMIGMMSN